MILLPVLVGCFFWNRLPETMATHFKLSGQANGFSSRWVTVFGLPSFLLVIHWLCIFVTSKDPKSSNVNPKARHLVYWIIPLASWFALGSIYARSCFRLCSQSCFDSQCISRIVAYGYWQLYAKNPSKLYHRDSFAMDFG